MTGCIFKRKLRTGVSWGYVFFGGWEAEGKRIQITKSGFATKDAATKAVRVAIEKYEADNGRVWREVGSQGQRVWSFTLGDIQETGYQSKAEAEAGFERAVARRDQERKAEDRRQAQETAERAGPPLSEYIPYWLREHAARRCAPKTLERYTDMGRYLTRELGGVHLNEMITAAIQEAIHRLSDHGGQRTKEQPLGRPLAPKTVRNMGALLYTVLSDAERLGVLKIPHPMANRRVLLPKLVKRKPAVLDETKLQTLFDHARGTRLYPFLVLAAATGCRRGELLALQWTDIDFSTSLLTVSKSLEQTRKGLRVKSTKSEQPRQFGVPEWALDVLNDHRGEQDRDRVLFGAKYVDGNLIFCQPDGQYYSPDRMGARVVEAMKNAGLEGVTLHSLRHSHASILLSKGVPVPVVSERLGHADQNITLTIYSHALPADSRAASKIWNDSMSEVIANAQQSRSSAKPLRSLRTGTTE
jgi:integrase